MEITKIDLKIVVEKLNESKRELRKQQQFMREHKFKREDDFIENKISIIQEIVFELDNIAEGRTKPTNAVFNFNR